MKTLFTLLVGLFFLAGSRAQPIQQYPSPDYMCTNLLIGDFSCTDCLHGDADLPEEFKVDVVTELRRYVQCQLLLRDNLSDLLSLSDNERAIASLDELSQVQIEKIRSFSEADRVIFTNLRVEANRYVVVTFSIQNLSTTYLEGMTQVVIPWGKQYDYWERKPYIEEGIAELILGEVQGSDPTSPDGTPDDDPANGGVDPSLPTPPSPTSFSTYSLVTDPGGVQYETIKVNNKEWLASNLKYAASDSWCFNNSAGYCRNYGRLYSYDAARHACAQLGVGWRLPSFDEWKELSLILNGFYMIQPNGQFLVEGTNPSTTYFAMIEGGNSGFEGKLAGRRDKLGNFNEFENIGFFWTSTPFDDNLSWAWMLMKINPIDGSVANSNGPLPWPKVNGHSCRCVKTIE